MHRVYVWCARVGVLAQRAVSNVIGEINDVEFGVAQIDANITRRLTDTLVSAVVHQIPAHLGQLRPSLLNSCRS